jgi:hypothetical protein
MEPLQYGPRTKQQIKDALYEFLYKPAHEQLQRKLETLIIRNTLLAGNSHKSFQYKGESYNADVTQPPLRRNRLVPQLKAQMDEYLEELRQINEEELPYVLGYINQVLNASNDLTDYLRLLPPAVHRPIQQFIKDCPCRAKQLSDERVEEIQRLNQNSINLIKARMVTNLII